MTDLNTLIPEDSNLSIIAASNINERGQISGMATVLTGPDTGKIHAILLTPVKRRASASRLQISHVHTRIPLCPRMPATLRGDSAPAHSEDKVGFFGARAPSSYMLRWRKAGDCAGHPGSRRIST